jgi:hypothetical protein
MTNHLARAAEMDERIVSNFANDIIEVEDDTEETED